MKLFNRFLNHEIIAASLQKIITGNAEEKTILTPNVSYQNTAYLP